jgi:diguanylate cyclase (GGDEF)-like protein
MTHVAPVDDAAAEALPSLMPLTDRLVRSLAIEPKGEAWTLLAQMIEVASAAERRLQDANRRVAELESLVSTDTLTGLPNRRGLQSFLDRHLALARRHGESGSVVFLDLDGLKTINDRFGHAAGDRAIAHAAEILARQVRATDFVARLAGDEFVAVLDRARPEDAEACMSRYERALLTNPIDLDGVAMPLRVSYGIVAFGPASDPDEVLREADAAMYAMKRTRRAARRRA